MTKSCSIDGCGRKVIARGAAQIVARLAKGEVGYQLAEEFGVHKATISDIRTGKTWKHIRRRA